MRYNLRCISVFMLCVSLCIGCSTSGKSRKDAFNDKVLSVYIRVESLDIPESTTDDELKRIMIDKGLSRYRVLLSALGSETGKTEYIEGITHKNPDYKILYINENEYYTEAMIDFAIPSEVSALYMEKYPPPKKKNEDE